jgi:fibronectin-binding autotransporter adhesin
MDSLLSPKTCRRMVRSNRAIRAAAMACLGLGIVHTAKASDWVYVGPNDGDWFATSNWILSSSFSTPLTSYPVFTNGDTTNINNPVNSTADPLSNGSTTSVVFALFDPAADEASGSPNAANIPADNYLTIGTGLGGSGKFYLSSSDVGPNPPTLNGLIVNSGTFETNLEFDFGRDGYGEVDLGEPNNPTSGGTIYSDTMMQLGIGSHNTPGQGVLTYYGGNLFVGESGPETVNTGTYAPYTTGSSPGLRMGTANNIPGTMNVYNTGAPGQMNVNSLYVGYGQQPNASTPVTGGLGILNFYYSNGGVRPIQVTGPNSTATGASTGELAIRNSAAAGSVAYGTGPDGSGGTLGAELNLFLDAAPTVGSNGAPQSLALITYDNGISSAGSGLDADFFSSTGTDLTEGSPISAAFNGVTYTWDIYYDGSVTFSNSSTSQIASISQTGGNMAAGAGDSGAVVLIGVPTGGNPTPNGQWLGTTNTSGTASWSASTNWSNGVIPQNAGDTASFATSSAYAVTLDGNFTVGNLSFSSATSYTISAGTGGTLTLANTGGNNATVTSSGASHTIAAPVVLGSNTTFAADQGTTLLITGDISGTGGVSVLAAGNIQFNGDNSYSGGTNIKGGSLTIGSSGGLPAGSSVVDNASLIIKGGTAASPVVAGSLSGSGTLTLGSSTVTTETGYLQLASPNGNAKASGGTSSTSGLTINAGSTLDITNNTLLVNYGTGTDPASTIRGYLISGLNATPGSAGNWQGTGIVSSLAATNPTIYTVGYADGGNAIDAANTGVAAGTVEVKYTVAGDANLSGGVDLSDLVIIASDFGQTGDDFAQGDVNYDGNVDLSDLVIVASNFGASLSSVASAGFSGSFQSEWNLALAEVHGAAVAVPEPGTIGLSAIGATALLSRRRRRN